LIVSYVMLERETATILRVLSFRIYVGVQKKKYYWLAGFFVLLVVTFASLKYGIFEEYYSEHTTIECNGLTVDVQYQNQYGSSLYDILIGVMTIIWAFQGAIKGLYDKFTDFYSSIGLKLILRCKEYPNAAAEFTDIRKIEQSDLELALYNYMLEKFPGVSERRLRKMARLSKIKEHDLAEVLQRLLKSGMYLKEVYE